MHTLVHALLHATHSRPIDDTFLSVALGCRRAVLLLEEGMHFHRGFARLRFPTASSKNKSPGIFFPVCALSVSLLVRSISSACWFINALRQSCKLASACLRLARWAQSTPKICLSRCVFAPFSPRGQNCTAQARPLSGRCQCGRCQHQSFGVTLRNFSCWYLLRPALFVLNFMPLGSVACSVHPRIFLT